MGKLFKYPTYKNTNEDWIREIPEHWSIFRLKYVFDITKRIVGEVGHDVLSITQRGIKIKDTESGAGQLSMDYSKYQKVDKGDFAMNHMDLLTGFVDISKYDGVISPDYRVFKLIHNESDNKFLLYILQLSYTQRIFFKYGKGVSMLGRWRLPAENFKNFLIPLPPKAEQTKIAAFLDYKLAKIERFIHKKKQLIKLLNKQKAAIINQAVTKGLDPNVRMKPSGIEWLENIPAHWEVKKLKYVANCFPSNIDKHTKENEMQVRLCNYTDVYKNDYITNNMELMIATATEDQIEKFTLLKGDVIITKDSETADDIANPALVVEELENVVCGYHLSVLRPYSKLEGSYLLRALQCKVINVQFEVCSNGVTRVGLGVYDMKSAKIPLPPKDEQQLIVNYIESEVNKIHKTISTIEREIKLTQEYKTALITEAVTGKIDVRDFETPVTLEDETYEDLEEELSIAAEDEVSYGEED